MKTRNIADGLDCGILTGIVAVGAIGALAVLVWSIVTVGGAL